MRDIRPDLPEPVRELLRRDGTNISWCDLSWNAWIGCTKVSPACDGCYAAELMGKEGSRLKRVGWGPGEDRLRTSESNWQKPLRWQRIAAAAGVSLDLFCLSLGDWADNEVPDEWRIDLGRLILATPNLRWLLLTKRISNAERYLRAMFPTGVPANVVLGITVVTQAEVDRDLPRAVAVKTRLAISRLFLSIEPLIEPIVLPADLLGHVDLAIVGGESGKEARPLHPAWVEALENQCDRWLVPFHFKQWGEFLPDRVERHEARSAQEVAGTVHFNRVGTRKAGRRLYGVEHLARVPA